MFVFRFGYLRRCLIGTLVATGLIVSLANPAAACPFCNAVSQTLRQEMSAMDAVVVAEALQDDLTRDKETGEILMKVNKVLKGSDHVSVGDQVRAIYYGEASLGRRFLMMGVDPPMMQWSCLPVSERAEAYVSKIPQLSDEEPLKRLKFYYGYLQDEESMLARDAYDEFAVAPYELVRQLAPQMNHDELVGWISDPETSTDRKRLFLTLLGVCGSQQDLPMLENMLRSSQKSTRGGLDALIACYLTLGGEKGLPLVNELFLNNPDAPYADTYAAIMAIRFHGTEGDVIPRSALVESLHHVLDRKDLADLVIPDLARWNDWSQIDRLTELFINADPDNNWVRVPVVNYLRACPLEEAKTALKKLEEVDPESVKRANTFFSIPVPARDTSGSQSSASEPDKEDIAAVLPMGSISGTKPGVPLASAVVASAAAVKAASPLAATTPMNRWRLAYVLSLAIATVMISQLLLLSGGAQPSAR